MDKIISQARTLPHHLEFGDYILAIMYLTVGIFGLEAPTLMGMSYATVGVLHIISHRIERADKARKAAKTAETERVDTV